MSVGGKNGTYPDLVAAYAASRPGDTIVIEPGTYFDDHQETPLQTPWGGVDVNVMHDLTIKCLPGAAFDARAAYGHNSYYAWRGGGNVAEGYIDVGQVGINPNTPNVLIEGCTFLHAGANSYNGAGVRLTSGDLTIINSAFRWNQDGVLLDPYIPDTGNVTLDHDTFDQDGNYNAGHSMYIGLARYFTLINSSSTNAAFGHAVKSRAANNIIENNVIGDTDSSLTGVGHTGAEFNIAELGNTIIKDNRVYKGPLASNPYFILTGVPDGVAWLNTTMTVEDNSFYNNDPGCTGQCTGPASLIWNQSLFPVTFKNNRLGGSAGFTTQIRNGTLIRGSARLLSGNVDTKTGAAVPEQNLLGFDFPRNTHNYSTTTKALTFKTARSENPGVVIGGAGHLTFDNNTKPGWAVVGGSGGITVNDSVGGMLRVSSAPGSTGNVLNLHSSSSVETGGGDVISFSGPLPYSSRGPMDRVVFPGGNAAVSDTPSSAAQGGEAWTILGKATIHAVDANLPRWASSVWPGGDLNLSGTFAWAFIWETGGTYAFHLTRATASSSTVAGSIVGGSATTELDNKAGDPFSIRTMPLEGVTFPDIPTAPTSDTPTLTVNAGDFSVYQGSRDLKIRAKSGTQTVNTTRANLNNPLLDNHGTEEFYFAAADGGATTINTQWDGGTFANDRWGTATGIAHGINRLVFTGFSGNPIANKREVGSDLSITLTNGKVIILKNVR
ncbi:MAG: hypothetical protein ACREFP_14435 [Acetobacteraceae bacterium]